MKTTAVLAVTALLGACASGTGSESIGVTEQPLARAFGTSARQSSVPRDLLVAIAQVEDGLTMPARRVGLDADAAVPAAGPLMLRHGKLDTLARAAALSHTTELALREDTDAALAAGALVLAELGGESGARAEDLASWKTAIEAMSGYADDAHRAHYSHRVFATLARGGTFAARDGESIAIDAHAIPAALAIDVSSSLHVLDGSAEYPGAEWIPTSCTNKCDADRGGVAVDTIVIHDTEGGWDASVATLQNDSGKSVQYIVGTDGHIAQFVTEETTAWHAGNYVYNQRSVGIEHVGYGNQPYAEAQYAASAKLVSYLATKYKVALDRAHVIGHDQIPNGDVISESSAPCSDSPKTCEASNDWGGANNHRDPGIWEWAVYMTRIGGVAKCDDVTPIVNCSNDKTHAFSCKNGSVEVLTCNGPGSCVVEANGVDDKCDVLPSSAPPGAPTAAPVADPPAAPAPAPSGDSGCSVASAPSEGGRGVFVLAIAALSVILKRRRKS